MKFHQAAAFAFLSSTWANPLRERQNSKSMVYKFDDIQSTEDLAWTPCYDIFTCMKLKVPLDYEDVAAGTTDIAFVRWTGNSTSSDSSRPDILLNPGGPGTSGVSMLGLALPQLLAGFGSDYNLVGFDPRGVNNSGPDLSCISGEKGTSRFYGPAMNTALDANDKKSYGEVYSNAAAFGDLCSRTHAAPNDAAKYANTVAVANDMRHYTELLAKSNGQDPKKSQLWYYGGSYGTVLGTTFAALFPDRVGRMMVDGVVDAEDYYNGKWTTILDDSDKGFRSFFQSCFDAGKEKCPFWADSPSAIEKRYEALIEEMTFNPVPVAIQVRGIVTAADLKLIASGVPYFPLASFERFARMLSELENRNGTMLAMDLGIGLKSNECTEPTQDWGNSEPRHLIACTDANGRLNLSTQAAFVEHTSGLLNRSHFLGEVIASNTGIHCHKLNIKAPKSQIFEGYPGANKTSNPLLFISTSIDPVTPLSAAKKMVKRFPGSGLLVQDNVGHGSLSSISMCTHEYMQAYLKDASLPEAGTICKPDIYPFQDIPGAVEARLVRRSLRGIW